MEVPLSLAAVLALVAANGFFVATEFALVSVRRTRIEQLVAQGSSNARSALDAINHLDAYIAATQLGITMASLALGWVGEPALGHLIEPLVHAIPFLPIEAREAASHTVSATIAFVVITALHIVLGELAPKSLALQRAEATALFVARPIHLFLAIFRLPIMALNTVGNAVVRVFGIQPASGHALVQSAEELKLSVTASTQAGLVNPEAQELVERALDFGALEAHHFMVPRTEMVALSREVRVEQVLATTGEHEHSRYPVYEGSIDNIIGVVSTRQLLHAVAQVGAAPEVPLDLRPLLSQPLFVPETLAAFRLLSLMKRERSHIAIVMDEYGVTAGLIALRDLMDRLAGELPDEAENPIVEWLPDGTALVDGLALLSEVERTLGFELSDADYDTLGGYLFGRLGRRPAVGDVVEVGDRQLEVDELDGLRVSRVRIRNARKPEEATA